MKHHKAQLPMSQKSLFSVPYLPLLTLTVSFIILLLPLSHGRRRQDAEPSLPSHLPSPPKAGGEGGGGGSSSVPGNSNPADSLFTRIPPLPAPPIPGPEGPLPHPGALHQGPNVPLGLEKLILILVPQFKMKIQRTAKYWGANVKLSFPITIFTDKLTVPPNSPPLYFFPFGPFMNPPPPPLPPVPPGPGGPPGRKKRSSAAVLSFPPPGKLKGGERAVIIPRLERLLQTFGLAGRACLLRAVCEVHESELSHYGFLGEILKLLFSITKSPYAESHLPQYHRAELLGREGNCSSYVRSCEDSLFHHHPD